MTGRKWGVRNRKEPMARTAITRFGMGNLYSKAAFHLTDF